MKETSVKRNHQVATAALLSKVFLLSAMTLAQGGDVDIIVDNRSEKASLQDTDAGNLNGLQTSFSSDASCCRQEALFSHQPEQQVDASTSDSSLHGILAHALSYDETQQQTTTVYALIARIVGEKFSSFFDVSIQPSCTAGHSSCFRVYRSGEKVRLQGPTAVEVAAGFHWFLKYRCGSAVTWELTGGMRIAKDKLREALNAHDEPLDYHQQRVGGIHYYQNVVTTSYSMAFWTWERWEQEIDWMALNGINMPLAFTGQEYVWQKVYRQLGLTDDEIRAHFGGPAFLSWMRMGNIHNYAGPLPQSWIDAQADLQRKILRRMREFGMVPVLPGFAGHVPEALARKYSAARFSRLPNWGGFPQSMCSSYLLDAMDPLFIHIGSQFVQMQREAWGYDRVGVYAADVFNEMTPTSTSTDYLKQVSAAVYKAMAVADPSAIWLMQAWLFYSDQQYWKPDRISAFLSGVPHDRLLLLDLFAEIFPIWSRTNSFEGRTFIWCMLQNFGGNSDMYGAVQSVAAGAPIALLANSSIGGVGLCPEAIEHNPLMYDLMNEMAFRREQPDLSSWVNGWVLRRYGEDAPTAAQHAWHLLMWSVYNCTDGKAGTVMDIPVSRPGLEPWEVGLWGLKPHIWYNPLQVLRAWELLIDSADGIPEDALPSFYYDLVDVGRQVTSKAGTWMWQDIVEAYKQQDLAALQSRGDVVLGLFDDLEQLLATNRAFMLGPRLQQARAAGTTPEESDLYEWNLRTQLTVWGTSDSGDSEIHDYANKEWAGLMGKYYKTRWQMWLDRLREDIQLQRSYSAAHWRAQCLYFTLTWAKDTDAFPTEPTGDVLAISRGLYQKYEPYVRERSTMAYGVSQQ